MSCIFCHSLDSSHSEEPATSVVDSMEESSDECWDSDSDVTYTVTLTRSMFPHQNGLWP